MERDELTELHYIAPFENVVSICQIGIVSHNRAAKIHHESVAMPEIQERRRKRVIPGAKPLHDYANLYICARNPMLYKLQYRAQKLCVLSVSLDVLDISGTVISDRNASSNYARFAPAPEGLIHVDKELVFAEYWTHEDQIEQWRHASLKCAEVLVPDRVEPECIQRAYVRNDQELIELAKIIREYSIALPLEVKRSMFFS